MYVTHCLLSKEEVNPSLSRFIGLGDLWYVRFPWCMFSQVTLNLLCGETDVFSSFH